jgi:hypothetical protein
MRKNRLLLAFSLLWWYGIFAQNTTAKVHELYPAAVRAYAMGLDLSAAEYSRQVLLQQPNHCASGSLIMAAAIRSDFCRPDLIRMTQQLMGNGCNGFQSHADLILALLYNDRAKEAGFALEQMHRKFPKHPNLKILEAELAIGLRRIDPFIESLVQLTGNQPDPEKVAFVLKRLDRLSNYFLDADSSRAKETLNRILIRHTASKEGKVLYVIWSRFRKQDPQPLALYFASYPQELDTYPNQYLPWLFLQTLIETSPKQAVNYLKKWTIANPKSPYYLIHALLQRQLLFPESGTKTLFPWNAPPLVSFLEPEISYPTLPYPPWFWEWTDTLTLAKTLFNDFSGKQTEVTVYDLYTAYEYTMRQDSLSKKQLLSLLKKQCEAHPIVTQKVYKKRQEPQDSVILFAMLYESIRQFAPSRPSLNQKKSFQMGLASNVDATKNNTLLQQIIRNGRLWAAAGFLRLTLPPATSSREWQQIQELILLLTRTKWDESKGYLPGFTEAALVQSTRKNITDTLWTQPLDDLTAIYGFPSLIPTP